MQILWANNIYRIDKQSQNTQNRANRRLDPQIRLFEQTNDKVQHRKRRQILKFALKSKAGTLENVLD